MMIIKEIKQYLTDNGWTVILNKSNRMSLKNISSGLEMSQSDTIKYVSGKFPSTSEPEIYEALIGILRDNPPKTNRTLQETLDKIELELPKIYYFNGKFYHKAQSDDGSVLWAAYSEGAIRRFLKYYVPKDRDDLENEILRKVENTQVLCDVCTLAGYEEGVHSFRHGRTLVEKSPTYITPKEGGFPMLDRLLTEMFGELQKSYLLSWLKVAVLNLRGGPSSRGQALFMVGDIGSCKTLLQDLITDLLGGRAADPHQYLLGQTTFNAEMFGAEHLLLGDKSGKNWEERGDYSLGLKTIISNNEHQRHQKGSTPQNYRPKWRITVSLNPDPDSLKVIPIITAGLQDKISILTVNKPHMEDVIPMDIIRDDDRLLIFFKAELPYFLHYLLNVFQIPSQFLAKRFGVVAFRDSQIEEQLKENINIQALYEALYELIGASDMFTGTCSKLVGLLHDKNIKLERGFGGFGGFSTPRDMSRTLMAMSDIPKYRHYIKYHEEKGCTIWEINFNDINIESTEPEVPEEPEDWEKDLNI